MAEFKYIADEYTTGTENEGQADIHIDAGQVQNEEQDQQANQSSGEIANVLRA
ncbi:MAG TPA: hypothetical protein VNW95_09485 [Mucilaginibacter sp.]|nr:hypothetical protein [Mucilaginibacter sp.]